MDTTGFSQVGRYGTLSLMKRQDPGTVVTAFGIDTEEITFGRDPSCSVRLYYPEINLTHCKITFEERKAFLIVLGRTGLVVDGCRVYPNGNPGGQPTTVPLSNNSEIEIHNKLFRFSYPPKEIRATLLATPAPAHNRKLRLSMIHSAQVFTPRPSKDPRENLRILQSPMKNTFRSPVKPSALSRTPITSIDDDDSDEKEENEIVLVNGNHPRVVEEDKDLVILEDVEVPVPQPVIHLQPPKTPQRRRSQSLHRAVLIRSAQRTVLEYERQRQQEEEEREEEMEVLDTIASDDVNDDEYLGFKPGEGGEHPPSDEEVDSDGDEAEEKANRREQKPLWRKSLERLWPFRSSSPAEAEADGEEGAEQEEQGQGPQEDAEEDETQDQPEALPSLPQATPIRRPLGTFMTPQAVHQSRPSDRGLSIEASRGRLGGGPPVRYSLGEPRRVPLEEPWRVRDIVVPLKSEEAPSVPPTEPNIAGTPRRSNFLEQSQTPRQGVTAEEKKAIQERRRSALRDVDSHSYFAGGIPGMSPSKTSASPTKPGFNDVNNPFFSASPTKRDSAKDAARRLSIDEEDEKLDTRSLLERMKETVEGMKRRRSTIGMPGSSPVKPPSSSSLPEEAVHSPFTGALLEVLDTTDMMDTDQQQHLLRSPDKTLSSRDIRIDGNEASLKSANESTPTTPVIVESVFANEKLPAQEELLQRKPETPQLQVPPRHSRTRSRSPQPPAEMAETATIQTTRKATAGLEEVLEAPIAEAPKRAARKTAKTANQEPPVPTHQPAVAGPTRRVRKPTSEIAEPPATRRGRKTPTVEEEPAPAAKRTARKVAVKNEKEEKTTIDPPTRRTRPPKATTVAEASEPEKNHATKRSTTRGRGAKTSPVEHNGGDGDDPLDTFNAPDQVDMEEPPQAVPPTKTETKARKTRTVVKQEEEPAEVLKAKRGSRSTTATTATATKTPAPTRGRPRKIPATAPAAPQTVDKENTPGNQTATGSSTKQLSGDTGEGVLVKVRTTRKTRTTTAKQESEEATTVPQPKPRTTRTTRVRTKTT